MDNLAILAAFYFVPTIIAFGRRHTNAIGVGIVNLTLGFTVIGWVAALVWACWRTERRSALPPVRFDVYTGQPIAPQNYDIHTGERLR